MASVLGIAWRAFTERPNVPQSQQNNGLYGAGDNISCLVEKGGLHPGQPTTFKQFGVVS